MGNININAENTHEYASRAIEGYKQTNDTIGGYLGNIQQTVLLFFEHRYDEAVAAFHHLLEEIAPLPQQPYLSCTIYEHLTHGMWMKRDMHASQDYAKQWQAAAVDMGNFHDYTRTSCMLTEYARQEQLSQEVVQQCINAMRYCKELGSYYGYATSAFVMGNICIDQKQYNDAIDYYQQLDESGT